MQWLINTLTYLPAILIALTFHEYAHGRVADMLGDSTPYDQGRLTLNPLPHIDWMGFLMLVLFKFGWAKPVQVNPYNFKKLGVKKGMMVVALAGPVMNLLLAFLGMFLLKILVPYQSSGWISIFIQLVYPLVYIDLILAAFNLIPVPPLDGSRILAGLLPDEGANFIYSLEKYGPLLLLLLIVTNLANTVISPLVNVMYGLMYGLLF